MKGPDISSQASLPTPNSTKSFWHSEPSEILLGHRTTSSLPTKTDVVIIGSGISGAFAAHWLREDENGKSLDIVMLEAREACWGATGRNGGHCQPMMYSSHPEIGNFEIRNYETVESLISKHNIQCDWRALSGCHAYMDPALFDLAAKAVKRLKSLDPVLGEKVQIITKDSTNPSLSDLRIPTAAGAVTQNKAASLWPYKLVAWILEKLLSLNKSSHTSFNIQTTTPVTHLQKLQDGCWMVHTPRGMIATEKVLLTTNGYTSHLLPSFSDLIVPVRGEMSSLIPPKICHKNPPLDYSYGFLGNGTQTIDQDDYLVQRPVTSETKSGYRGELMFGGARSYAANAGLGVSDDSAIDEPAAAYLRRELNLMLDLGDRGKGDLEATYQWSGIMGYSRDWAPWVGEVSDDLGVGGGEGVYVSAGFTGHGMPNTVLCAKAVVDMMMGKGKGELDLPKQYRMSKERAEKARKLDEVHIADGKVNWLDFDAS